MTVLDDTAAFDAWLEAMSPALGNFEDFQMPEQWERGFTRESLHGLETYLLDRWPSIDEYEAGADPGFVDGAGRYVGESFLRVAGGRWWVSLEPGDPWRGSPVVLTAVFPGLPVAPYSLVTASLHRRTGRELVTVHDNLRSAVDDRRRDEGPDWQPPRAPVQGITAGTGTVETVGRETATWRSEVPELLGALRARVGPAEAAGLDLSASSLGTVATRALGELQADDLGSTAATDVERQYLAYVGETLLAVAGGRWIVRPGDPTTNMFLGNPYVERTDGAGETFAVAPFASLGRLLRTGRIDVLEHALEVYTDA